MSDSRTERHPAQEALERFMAGEATAQERREILAHLLTDCSACRAITGPLVPFGRTALLEESDESLGAVTSPESSSVSGLLARLREREKAIERERGAAPALLAEIDAQAPAHQLLLVRNSSRFCTWALAELLINESFRHRFDDVQRTQALAELGVEVADRLDPGVYGAGPVNDLRARAWATRGNALRLRSDLRQASNCLTRALKLLEHGTGDPLEEARVCELFAVLRSNQSRIHLAVRLQERAIRLYRRADHRERLGKAMVDLASYNALAGDRDHAIALIEKALQYTDSERDPHTVLAARHNLAVFLQESGRLREALDVLALARSLYEKLGDRRNLLRMRWLEGRLARDLGDAVRAENAFEEVYRAVIDQSPIFAAEVALDLALLYLDTGREADVPAVVVGVERVFRANDIERDALAAWLVLSEAVDRRRLHKALIEDVAARLQAVRDRPTG
jgi:tetratricopeptide (TPR) repeat protein